LGKKFETFCSTKLWEKIIHPFPGWSLYRSLSWTILIAGGFTHSLPNSIKMPSNWMWWNMLSSNVIGRASYVAHYLPLLIVQNLSVWSLPARFCTRYCLPFNTNMWTCSCQFCLPAMSCRILLGRAHNATHSLGSRTP